MPDPSPAIRQRNQFRQPTTCPDLSWRRPASMYLRLPCLLPFNRFANRQKPPK